MSHVTLDFRARRGPHRVTDVPLQSHRQRKAIRVAAGKALRQRCSRQSLAEWGAHPRRSNPVDLLIENNKGRLKDLIPLRYGRMMADPFSFYRGAAVITARDLVATPVTGIELQACGDCHLLNFGGFATPERKIVFDIDDFDETSVAPWEWDVKRLTSSFVVAARSNGFDSVDCREVAWLCARSYRQAMAGIADMSVLEAWYAAIDLEQLVAASKILPRFYRKKLQAARAQCSHERQFARLAYIRGRHARIKDDPPLIFHTRDQRQQQKFLHDEAIQALASYKESIPPERRILMDRYELADEAYKVVGLGSVGLVCGVALFVSGNGDPLFLQFKEARRSVLEPYAGTSPFPHHGQRVVVGQRIMQSASDIFLGWMRDAARPPRHFYMRQMRDAKIKPMVAIMEPLILKRFARLCGRALARAHSRSGDAAMLSGYLGRSDAFEDAMTKFSVAYADQNESDHAALLTAIRAGRIQVRESE